MRINLQSLVFKRGSFVSLFLFVCFALFAVDSEKVIITEFMAVNNSVLGDQDGDYSDWIELYNPGTSAINLSGWFLTDDANDLTQWQFPSVSLAAGGYLVVFASNKNYIDPTTSLHTNFKLSGSGEFIALVEADGATISSSYAPFYPVQQQDIAYGVYNGQNVFLNNPTPGEANDPGSFVLPPSFSKSRGFYSNAFSVVLTALEANHDIYYTLNGEIPSTESSKYSSAISISTTTVLSAIAVDKSSGDKSQVITHSYLFPEHVLTQSASPAGYPSEWGPFLYASGNAPADYEMDPQVCTASNKADLLEGLSALPSLSIVTNPGYLFSHSEDANSGGIYIYTGDCGADPKNLGTGWERPVSMEYFDPATSVGFQVNCGMRLHGGNSRKPSNSPKHSFRVSFRDEYGVSKLNYDLFDEDKGAAKKFNSLVIRAGYNYGWVKNSPAQCDGADYMKDPFAKMTQLDMDRVSAHNKFVHLYLNGLYWGIYNISEKITNDFIESYEGGNEEDYDVVSDDGLFEGTMNAWDALKSASSSGFSSLANYQKVQGLNVDGSVNAGYSNLLDVRNLVDYMIINLYVGNKDWDKNNWYVTRNRVTNESGFKFYCWDVETSLIDVNENIVEINNGNNPSSIYNKLQANSEFKLYFADRLQKHFFNGGALTPVESESRYMSMVNKLRKAIMLESARWGDYRRDVSPASSDYDLYTVNQWNAQVSSMQTSYFPQRTNIVLGQFKSIGLFPNLAAPILNPYGGDIYEATNLNMSSLEGDIYFTTDDTDPREIGGAVSVTSAIQYSSAFSVTQDMTVKARVKSGNEWSPLVRAKFNYHNTSGIEKTDFGQKVTSSCYPNPASEMCNITYNLPVSGDVSVRIISLDGVVLDELVNEYQFDGSHTVEWIPSGIANGIYFYQIVFDNNTYSGKIILNQ